MSEGQYRPCPILVNTILLPFPDDVPVSMWATRERRAAMRKRCPHTHRLSRHKPRVAFDSPVFGVAASHCRTSTGPQCPDGLRRLESNLFLPEIVRWLRTKSPATV